jgi:hypothetical protein
VSDGLRQRGRQNLTHPDEYRHVNSQLTVSHWSPLADIKSVLRSGCDVNTGGVQSGCQPRSPSAPQEPALKGMSAATVTGDRDPLSVGTAGEAVRLRSDMEHARRWEWRRTRMKPTKTGIYCEKMGQIGYFYGF